MRNLLKMVERWKAEGLVLLPPEPETAVLESFARLGAVATADVISMYSILGGMHEMDKEYWRLWPLSEVQSENDPGVATGVLFSDYLISCWSYRLIANKDNTSSVVADYFDNNQCTRVASSLEQFFGKYVEDPYQLLEDPPRQEPSSDA
jgi:hypothetical protein